ncbi:hypothetical protein GE21DRAFT_8280 [Neurospora crassa]|uniref:Uncharacterized protein n=2 Tax=Neurospora crassa TaxID=5141 RepID=Q1K784_NEUCR|nr:hypothetical protein NCU04285 [Neurospora crassa OR74A]EAA31839.1 hypothetical protein NCU04285 [Neurospora crassa OR74A]KHE82125.1 hypothetical protein GE21DRAFT_8280 [Neurospora crassa]CAC18617.2 hypothetical protein [Neurospora crassa]|eukprot:XP_961075.1 hypothetical protein NCU04285 [Neurospora crassa OR74A]
MLRSKIVPNTVVIGPPPQKRRPNEPLPNGTKRQQQRTSPRLANNKRVTDNASSSRPSAPQPKPAQTFKERLFSRPQKKRKPTPEPAKVDLHSRPQTTIAPFFKKLQAAFGEETQPASKQKQQHKPHEKKSDYIRVPPPPTKQQQQQQPTVQTRKRKRESPVKQSKLSSETEDMLAELRAHYLTAATNLHSHALTSLTKAHSLVIKKLDDSIGSSEEKFLQDVEKRASRLSLPLSEFVIRSDQRGSDGVMRSEKHVISDLVKRVEKKLVKAETEMEGLWREWVESEKEMERVLENVLKEVEDLNKGKSGKKVDGEGDDPPGASGDAGKALEAEKSDDRDMLTKYEEAIEEEVEKAEEEVTKLTLSTYQMMKDLEKDYRKVIIPDLHLFYTSIEDV